MYGESEKILKSSSSGGHDEFERNSYDRNCRDTLHNVSSHLIFGMNLLHEGIKVPGQIRFYYLS